MKSDYQPKEANLIIRRFKYALAMRMINSWGFDFATAPPEQAAKAVLCAEHFIKNHSIEPFNEEFMPASICRPKGGGLFDRNYLNHAIAVGIVASNDCSFGFGALAPKFVAYDNTLVSAFLPILNEEEQFLAITWMGEVLNFTHNPDYSSTINSWVSSIASSFWHDEIHNSLGANTYSIHKEESRYRVAAVAALDRYNGQYFIVPEKPSTINNWQTCRLNYWPDVGRWCAQESPTQAGFMPLRRQMLEKKLKFQLAYRSESIVRDPIDFTPSEKWDEMVEKAKKDIEQYITDLGKAKKPASKKKAASPAGEPPPWAYDANGKLWERWGFIANPQSIPEEHRVPAITQFIQELRDEYTTRTGQQTAEYALVL